MNDQNDVAAKVAYSSDEYLSLLNLLHEVAEGVTGKITQDSRRTDEQTLAFKLFAHGLSAYKVSNPDEFVLPITQRKVAFSDLNSLVVLGRACLDTYLTFREVFIDPQNEDEFEFSYCVWLLSDYVMFEHLSEVDTSLREQHEAALRNLEHIRRRLKKTQGFSYLTAKQQKAALLGVRKRNWGTVLKNAQLGEKTYRLQFRYASGYSHGGGMTSRQAFVITDAQERREFVEIELTKIMVLLSKMILDYSELHSESMETAARYVQVLERARFWSQLASEMN